MAAVVCHWWLWNLLEMEKGPVMSTEQRIEALADGNVGALSFLMNMQNNPGFEKMLDLFEAKPKLRGDKLYEYIKGVFKTEVNRTGENQ